MFSLEEASFREQYSDFPGKMMAFSALAREGKYQKINFSKY